MGHLSIDLDGRAYRAEARPHSIAIPLRFDGPQPGFFGAPAAASAPLHVASFTGDTRRGGSCNAAALSLVPHCNGTHTECIGHLTDERASVHDLAHEPLVAALLVTLTPAPAAHSEEADADFGGPDDALLTRTALDTCWREHGSPPVGALIVRTLPNGGEKLARRYDDAASTPYFTVMAMEWVVERGIRHLLVDTPSVDRIDDGGRLWAHRTFWGLPRGSRTLAEARRSEATITELVYAGDEIADGLYLLDLQIAPFVADAAPSRPLLYRVLP